jgi:lysyl-tRNA synthetase class I
LVSKKEVLVFALEDFNRLPQNMRKKIITTLLSENVKTFSREDQKKILNHVRNTLNWIHNYGDDNQKKQTRDLLKIYKKFEPKDLPERH